MFSRKRQKAKATYSSIIKSPQCMAVTSPPADVSPPCCQELKKTGNIVPIKTQMGSSLPPQPCALSGPCFGTWLGPAASEKPPGAFGFMALTLTSGSTERAPHVALTPVLPPSPRAWACKSSVLQGYTLGASDRGTAGPWGLWAARR